MAKRSLKKPAETARVPIALDAKPLAQSLLIVAAILWIYAPALNGDWLWDDDHYITGNPLLHTTAGLWKIWFQPGVTIEYYPLEATVTWLQWQLWGLHPLGYHLTNVLLHIAGSLLVWRLLSHFRLKLAWLGGLLFAIHPAQVESVAWIAELKNTLSLPLLLGAICLYLAHDETRRARDYWVALALFAIALLCKISGVFVPFVILLHAWWKRGRLTRADAITAAPFFAIALAVGLLTIVTGVWAHQFTVPPYFLPAGGILGRIDLAGLAFAFYFAKVFWPAGFLPVYPLWPVDYTAPAQYLPWAVAAGVTAWLWARRQSWGRHALLGLGFFVINLSPCPGLIPTPNMGYAWVMDHFLYLPIIGLIGLIVAALEQLSDCLPSFRPQIIAATALVLIWLGWLSHTYAGLYLNSKTLWTYTLQHNPTAWPAHNNLGAVIEREGDMSGAIAQFHQAFALNPNDFESHGNLGGAYMLSGRAPEALGEYEAAIRLKPDVARAHNNLGNVLKALHRPDEARQQYEQALKLSPDYGDPAYNLGLLQLEAKNPPAAIAYFQQAIESDPDNASFHFNLGLALAQTGRLPEAMAEFQEAVRLDPNDAEARFNLGLTLRRSGRLPEAIEQYGAALRANPRYAEACNNLGIALYQQGRTAEAVARFEQALRLKPDYADARTNLAGLSPNSPSRPNKAFKTDQGVTEGFFK